MWQFPLSGKKVSTQMYPIESEKSFPQVFSWQTWPLRQNHYPHAMIKRSYPAMPLTLKNSR